jgi:serine/threonine-protein kinase
MRSHALRRVEQHAVAVAATPAGAVVPLRGQIQTDHTWALLALTVLMTITAVALMFNVVHRSATPTSQYGAQSATTTTSVLTSTVVPSTAAPTSTIPTATARPPLVIPPDEEGATCGSGIKLVGQQGWPIRAGRGTPETSCAFAFNVLKAYRSSDAPNADAARTITADEVTVQCVPDNGDAWIVCTGERNARVYLF